MTLEEFMSLSGPKYIVVASEVHSSDEVAMAIAPEPRKFVINSIEYVAINVEPLAVPELASYISQQVGVEFEFIQGNGNAALLTQQQVLNILEEQNDS